MSKSTDYKYVWENRRGLYRVVTDTPTYNSETRKTTHHYVTVGKAYEKDGPIIFGPKFTAVEQAKEKPAQVKTVVLCGERIVLDRVSRSCRLDGALKKAFGNTLAEKVLSLAYYLVSTGEPLSCAGCWLGERGLGVLDAPRVSELLPLLSEDACSAFFKAWIGARAKGRSLCYDITSVSTYSQDMCRAEYGYNRDHERWMKQINLAMLTDKESHHPLAFRVVNGSMSDGQTLRDTVRELRMYGADPYGLVMDRGFWSEERLRMLSEEGIKFMIPVPSSVGWAKKLISSSRSDVYMNAPMTSDDGETTYGCTVYDPTGSGRRVWAHVYYSPSMEAERKNGFVAKYMACRNELESGNPRETHQAFYDQYFEISTRGRGGKPHVRDKKPLDEVLGGMNFGYWVLYTDMEKDASKALADYRDRSFIEAGFDDLKGGTDARRLRVHHDKSVYGRIFLQFCAQILRTELRNRISGFNAETRKYAHSVDSLLTRVRTYSKVVYQGRYKSQFTAKTKGQKLIFNALGICADDDVETDEVATETLLS